MRLSFYYFFLTPKQTTLAVNSTKVLSLCGIPLFVMIFMNVVLWISVHICSFLLLLNIMQVMSKSYTKNKSDKCSLLTVMIVVGLPPLKSVWTLIVHFIPLLRCKLVNCLIQSRAKVLHHKQKLFFPYLLYNSSQI